MMRRLFANRTTIHVRHAAALCTLAVVLAACGDANMGPRNARSANAHGTSAARFDGSYSFTYDPTRGITTKLSDKLHTISIPAYGICDPAASSYGPGTWDDPCQVLTHSITITVNSYSNADGTHPYLDFSPALRFVPSVTTILTFNMKKVTVSDFSTINYCVTADLCVNEGLTDPSLATYNDGKGKISRRIKHFSGYNVAAGIECEVSDLDPDCIDLTRGLLNRTSDGLKATLDNSAGAKTAKKKKSGYMVVSGIEEQ
jgi:hypothetical protein